MATSAPVRVLIADKSLNRAHEIDSILRNAGIHTRPEFIADLAATSASINTHHPDLVVCNAGFDVLDALLPRLREGRPDLPIIVVDPTSEPANLTRALSIGATDVVWPDDQERLLHVIKREIAHVCERHRWKDTRRALKEAERRCELLLANSTAAIAYVHEGMHIFANDDYYKLFGFTDADDMLGVPLLDLMDPVFAEQFKAKMKAFRTAEDETRFSFRGRRVTGEPLEGEMTLTSAEYEGEHCTQVLVRRRPDAMQSSAVTPAASASAVNGSGVVRSGIDELFAAAERLFAAEDGEGALFVIEVDDFDTVLREHGLLVGERIMAALGEAIRAEASDEAGEVFLSRVGTERFVLAIPGATPASCDVLAEHMRKYVEELLLDVDGRAVRCTITLGADVTPAVGALRATLEGAFRAMLDARKPAPPVLLANARAEAPLQNGAAAVSHEVAEELLEEDEPEGHKPLTPDQQRILDLVNKAIETGKFVLLFQPIISLRGDSDEHYEVFLRLTDEKGDRLSPDHFLKLAIDHGVAGKIDRWVILQSIKLLSMHRSKGHATRLTINLTFNSLVDPDFVQWLGVAIKAARLPSDAVIFQIAEPDTAAYPREAREFLAGLRSLHCRSSLRHFGTVPEPFENLQRLPVDFVKLDGGHIKKVNDRPEARETLTEMIRELQSHGKLTIVPMVESATVLAALWQAGANYIQGHYLQEPSTEMNYDFTSDD